MIKNQTNKWVQRIWLIASMLITILYAVAYIMATDYIGDGITDSSVWRMYASWVATVGFPVVGFLILAAWFTKGGRKAIPIICALICVFIIGMSYFAYSFSLNHYSSKKYEKTESIQYT